MKRRWKYLLVGADTEDAAVELGQRLEAEVPEGARVGIGRIKDVPHPVFVMLGSQAGCAAGPRYLERRRPCRGRPPLTA